MWLWRETELLAHLLAGEAVGVGLEGAAPEDEGLALVGRGVEEPARDGRVASALRRSQRA